MRKKLRQLDSPAWLQFDVRPFFRKISAHFRGLIRFVLKSRSATAHQLRTAPLFLLFALLPALLIAWLHWSGFARPLSVLNTIKEHGKLVVATRYGPTTYFNGPDGPAGFEYDLIKEFAESIGVKAEFVIPGNAQNIQTLINKKEADLVATGMPHSSDAIEQFNLGPDYLEVAQLIVTHREKKTIKDLKKITRGVLTVTSDTSQEVRLSELKKAGELKLPWKTADELDSERLLYLINEEVIDYTIVDSNEYAYFKRYFENLKQAYQLSKPQPVAWMMRKSQDLSLQDAVTAFFTDITEDGTLKRLKQRYYAHIDKLKELDTDTFWKRVDKRLPKYLDIFKEVGDEYEVDWHLLAAVGYQESHWNPKAVSPTGVRGMMMLTNATAKQVKIKDRTHPEQSVIGAARYILWLQKQLPDSLEEKDKIWFTLAAYNVGLGHLEDARVLTKRAGANPDSWIDVRKRLPLLGQKKWYSTVKYGYARGREPVTYVDNIRNFYELLVWRTNSEANKAAETAEEVKVEKTPEAPATAIEADAESKPDAGSEEKTKPKKQPEAEGKPEPKLDLELPKAASKPVKS